MIIITAGSMIVKDGMIVMMMMILVIVASIVGFRFGRMMMPRVYTQVYQSEGPFLYQGYIRYIPMMMMMTTTTTWGVMMIVGVRVGVHVFEWTVSMTYRSFKE